MSASPPRPLGLRANVAWTALGTAGYTAAQWGVLVVTAKVLDVEAVGRLALALALTAPVFMFANLSLRNVQAADAVSRFRFRDYLHLRLVLSLTAVAAILAYLAVASHGPVTTSVIALLAFAKAAESLSDIHHGLFQKMERMDWIGLSFLAKAALTLLGFLAAACVTRSLPSSVAILLASWLAILLGLDVRLARRCCHEPTAADSSAPLFFPAPLRDWDPSNLKALATLAWPLGIVATVNSLTVNTPRYFVARHCGDADLGVFAAIAYLISAVGLAANAVGQAATPRMSRLFASGDRRPLRVLWLRLLLFAAALGILGVAVAGFLGRPILSWFYGPEYAARKDVFVLLAVAGGLAHLQSICWYTMTSVRELRIQMPIYVAAFSASVGLSALLVPSLGLRGAAYAVIASHGIGFLGGLSVGMRALSRMPGERGREPEPPDEGRSSWNR